MKLILLSGGSGKRLWPLSNDSRSKQFLKILENEQGIAESMVQRVWNQLKNVNLSNNTVIATSKSQVDMIQSQLENEAGLIIEPCRRDTFPAIALAASFLYSEGGVNPDEVVAVLPVDPYVQNNFFDKVKELETVISETNSDLALIGVTPTYPSEKYGYIVPEANSGDSAYSSVERFTEKPKENVAEELIEKGALWNCGVFAFRLRYVLSILEQKGYPTDYFELLAQYESFPKISFDYEVVEKAEKISVVSYDGYWKDLGTWNTLTEEMSTKQLGKGVICDKTQNTHLINELDIPVTVLGANNLVVAASPDGILVAEKEASPQIKELVSGFDQRPMYEERRWGWYKVLDYTKFEDGSETLTKRIGIAQGKNLSYQQHYQRSEVWTVIKGYGEFILNDQIFQVNPGDVLEIPVSAKHSIRAISELEIIEVQRGSQLVEEDIIRLETDWDAILESIKAATVAG
ncbi:MULTISPECIES: sugar phosphate nucleotidyltransferase [Bacillus]|uniref:Mannose-1-phosphate guanylyltransferase n=2 Tax=Bacillus TaxID=1386 RepID=A0A0M4FYY3_9BACI|nr:MULTISPECIES: sugar phosphate nucleotidyltransferase [Bacillus]ALC82650.1 mannose-1-phosphate guanylyltransferase [Bacillus gobiensis]MBP1081595.1 mannose-1-phosphate guanylyltransferase [Bacillus capparidis]MED1096254.1 sugar phosphate nucleotidyltransferase [Bacillus capparidis]